MDVLDWRRRDSRDESRGGVDRAHPRGGRGARAAVHVEVISALRRLEAARARQDVGRAAVDQARESQRIVRDRFEAGITPVDEVLRVSTALLDAEASQVAALVDTMVATAMLRRALGRNPYL